MPETGKRQRETMKKRELKTTAAACRHLFLFLGAVLTPIVSVNADAERSRLPSYDLAPCT
jgi:hypothetical protein